jgi:hypothetical protein
LDRRGVTFAASGDTTAVAAMDGGVAALRAAVQANCHVTDARHARNMTLCTYLLEMREFCRWERGAALTAPLPRADVGAWIAGREALWATVEEDDYRPLPVAGEQVDPYDTATVNRALVPQGFVYGAGIGRFGKPQFFLGELEREERRDGLRILVAGRELARDLSAAPAALRDDTVSIRLESLARVLWERAEAWAVKRPDGALKAALDAHGFDPADAASLDRMVAAEAETLILHELGERAAGQTLGPGWEEMLAGLTRRRAELFARAVRDHLADCLVTLPALIERDAPAPIHFWFANLDGLRRELFPRAIGAYDAWHRGDRGRALRSAVAAGVEHWQRVCADVLRTGGDESAIEALSLASASRL